jgi:uncharacterized membrane protein
MDVARAAFPLAWIAITSVIAVAVLGLAILRAPWRRLADSRNLNVWCGAVVALTVLWSVRAELAHGVVIHLLGMAGLALMAGPWLALVGGALVVALCAWLHGAAPAAVPTEFLASVLVPVAVVLVVLRLTQRFLPPNLFVYTIVAAFLGAALGAFLAGLASAVSFVAAGVAANVIFGEYVPYLIFLAFGEATLTGMALTLAVVYRPHWVATFDDDLYLARGP